MRIYLVTDLAGVAGVNSWRQLSVSDGIERQEALRLLTGEVNAAIQGILDMVLQVEIVVWDTTPGGGLLFTQLHPEARVLLGGWETAVPPLLDTTFDAMILIGQHAMAGTPNSPLAHSYAPERIASLKLNGIPIGEIGAIVAQAGGHHVPIVAFAGDAAANSEVRSLLPEVATIETRSGIDGSVSLHRSAERVRQEIRETVGKNIKKIRVAEGPGTISPRRLEVERKLLSAMLWGGAITVSHVAMTISPADLRKEEHPPVFAAMLTLTEQGRTIDVLTLQYELRRMECLDQVGREFLLHLAEVSSDPARVDDYLIEFQRCDQPDRDHLPILHVEAPYSLQIELYDNAEIDEAYIQVAGFTLSSHRILSRTDSDLAALWRSASPILFGK